MRPTTLSDAKKLGLVPSVTTIMNVEDKPGLLQYKMNQVLDAAVLYPYDESKYIEKFWRMRIMEESQKISKAAAERGNQLHNALEDYYTKGTVAIDHAEFIEPVIKLIEERFPGVKWIAEKSFAHCQGFGGKVDLHSPEGIVLDFKSKDTEDPKKMVAFDSHHMQTAAYAVGLKMSGADRFNLFISTHKAGLLGLSESVDFAREWGMFESLMSFWQLKSNYSPRLRAKENKEVTYATTIR